MILVAGVKHGVFKVTTQSVYPAPHFRGSSFYFYIFLNFKYILLIVLLQLSQLFSSLYPPPPCMSPSPTLQHSPPLVHVHGSYI